MTGTLGVIYVVLFSNGVIKIGRTSRPFSLRLAEHRRPAHMHLRTIEDYWVSEPFEGYGKAETILRQICFCFSDEAPRRREWFTDVDFGLARQYAEWMSTRLRARMVAS
ncbi:hypothetical protein Misp01_52330 [Microtetraspora sp. NBRC 13810]|uniref:GIY-YIG nuclease family protein n=1 Tax=Microtetraspora sp. NBRC 13810 TaxID=3030990 RepID=UPI0025570961|nr:GIY-YIG nuclease family protein [Microtetraspora sp. NBRC 13810]GLW10104.1 hypothetical protein Misp01_52330 [Microtetraspora sp. NBRC 13810]